MDYYVRGISHFCNIAVSKCAEMPMRAIKDYDLTFVIRGSMTYHIGGVSYRMKDGDALFIPPNTPRSRDIGTEPVHYVSFNFSLFEDISFSQMFLPRIISGEIINLVCSYPFSHLSALYYSRQKCISILNYILFDLLNYKQLDCGNEHVAKMLRYVSENLKAPISLSTAASVVGLSKQHAAALFKKEMSLPFTQYLNDRRLLLARDLIIHSDLSLTEIAKQVGFENYHYFSRLFAKKYNITAARLKNTARR